MKDPFVRQLIELAVADPRISLVTGDLGFGMFEAFVARCPRQFFNAGVAEQNMTGMAAGLALEGRTVFTYSIANFATLRCLEQIRNDAAYHGAEVKIVSNGAGFSYGALGFSHHATEDVAIIRALPGVTLLSPGCDWEAEQCTIGLAKTPGVGVLRLDRASAGRSKREGEEYRVGRARIFGSGKDVALVSTGGTLGVVLAAFQRLGELGIGARVIHHHSIVPFDTEGMVAVAKETKGVITVEEHTVRGGLGGLVAEELLENGAIPGFFHRIGLRGVFGTVVGNQEYLRGIYGITPDAVVECAKRALASTSQGVRLREIAEERVRAS